MGTQFLQEGIFYDKTTVIYRFISKSYQDIYVHIDKLFCRDKIKLKSRYFYLRFSHHAKMIDEKSVVNLLYFIRPSAMA